MTNKTKITERGWAGHFICADRCRFRRNTLIECGERRVVVSSVGLMVRYRYAVDGYKKEAEGFEKIGYNRYYETMAFEAFKDGPYWEADVGREVAFLSPWHLSECEQESDAKMNDQHDVVVREIADSMAAA